MDTTKCPYCKEEIKSDAVKCKHCGSMLTGEGQPTEKITSDTKVKLALANRYEIVRQIGKGGMATVYEAIQKNLNRRVALKVIHLNLIHDEEFLSRFHREAQIAASLDHPNIVTVYDEGQLGDVHYMAMQYLEGKDLHTIVREKGKLSVDDTISYISPIAEALDYAHGTGVVHRDIKSSNIIITIEGKSVLTDFGIAHAAAGTKLTQTGTVIGTPEYMSPEQAEGKEIDYRSDLYSLGIVMYECLTGEVPFKGDNPITVIRKILDTEAKSIREIHTDIQENVDTLVNNLLKKNPKLRVQTGQEISKILKGVNVLQKLEEKDKTKKIITPKVEKKSLPREKRSTKKKKVILFSSIVLVIITVSIIVYLFIEHKQKQVKIEELFSKVSYHLEREEFVGPDSNNAKYYLERIIEIEAGNKNAQKTLAQLPIKIKRRIEKLLSDANELFKKGNIMEPGGNNAITKINQVLEFDSSNINALKIQDKFISRLTKLFDDFIDQDNKKALYFISQAVSLEPNNKSLINKLKLCRLRIQEDEDYKNLLEDFLIFNKKLISIIENNNIQKLKKVLYVHKDLEQIFINNLHDIFTKGVISSMKSEFYIKNTPNTYRIKQAGHDGQGDIWPPLGVFGLRLEKPFELNGIFYGTTIQITKVKNEWKIIGFYFSA